MINSLYTLLWFRVGNNNPTKPHVFLHEEVYFYYSVKLSHCDPDQLHNILNGTLIFVTRCIFHSRTALVWFFFPNWIWLISHSVFIDSFKFRLLLDQIMSILIVSVWSWSTNSLLIACLQGTTACARYGTYFTNNAMFRSQSRLDGHSILLSSKF